MLSVMSAVIEQKSFSIPIIVVIAYPHELFLQAECAGIDHNDEIGYSDAKLTVLRVNAP